MERARKQRNIPPAPSPAAPVKRRRGRPKLTDRLITSAVPAENDADDNQEEQDLRETPAPVLDMSAGTAGM